MTDGSVLKAERGKLLSLALTGDMGGFGGLRLSVGLLPAFAVAALAAVPEELAWRGYALLLMLLPDLLSVLSKLLYS